MGDPRGFSCSKAERAAPSSGFSANSCFYSFSNGELGPRVALGLHFLEVAEGRDSQLSCVFFILGQKKGKDSPLEERPSTTPSCLTQSSEAGVLPLDS